MVGSLQLGSPLYEMIPEIRLVRNGSQQLVSTGLRGFIEEFVCAVYKIGETKPALYWLTPILIVSWMMEVFHRYCCSATIVRNLSTFFSAWFRVVSGRIIKNSSPQRAIPSLFCVELINV